MNNLTKIAALPTGGGCQSALRPEDRGTIFATGGPVSPGPVILDREDGPELRARRGAPQQLVPIMVALGGFKELPALNPKPHEFVCTFTVGDVASLEMVQQAVAASARRAARALKGGAA